VALVGGTTKAPTVAARVALAPEELPLSVAEMLDAQVVIDPQLIQGRSDPGTDDGTCWLPVTLGAPRPLVHILARCAPS